MRKPELYIGRPIYSLQTMLRSISEVDDRILPVIPDGQYGRNTFASVQSFQHAYGLPITGEVDLPTWQAIVNTFQLSAPHQTNPSTAPIWSTNQILAPGQFNYHVYLVQAMLNALSDYFPIDTPPGLTGFLDNVTQQWLRWIQAAADLPQNGSLDTATWNYLNGLYRTIIADGSKERTAMPSLTN